MTPVSFYNIIIALIITIVVTAVVTFILAGRFEKNAKSVKEEIAVSDTFPAAPGVVWAPVNGEAVKRKDIPDETFASGVLGEGIGIQPSDGIVKAPFAGTIPINLNM